MITRKRVIWVMRWTVSVGVLGWIFTRPEMGRLGSDLKQLDFFWLLGGFLCAGLSLVLGSWRWQACLRALGMEISLGSLFRITLSAAAAGCVSFGALGTDLAKVALTSSHLPVRYSSVVTSIVMDHVSALPCVVGMILAAVLAHGAMPALEPSAMRMILIISAVVILAVIFVAMRFKLFHANLMQMLQRKMVWEGLMIAAFRSVPVWITYCGIYYCAARAFGANVPPVGFAGVMAIADGVASLPMTIGGLGVREQAFQLMLGEWYGVPASAAVAMSLTGFSLFLVWAAVGAIGFGGCVPKPKKLAIS